MALISGTRVGPYEIQAPLGAWGMGEVYRAKDTRLGRDVALKILSEMFARDSGHLRRFEQEARAVAALNHPNILAIPDIGEQNGSRFLVSELLEGETLRALLERAPLPQRKAISYCRPVCRESFLGGFWRQLPNQQLRRSIIQFDKANHVWVASQNADQQ